MTDIDSGLAFILEVSKVQSVITKRMEGRLSVHGLGFNDFVILHYLSQSEGKLRRIDLAEKINVTASGVTRLLAPMEKMGLVARESNERDARSSFVVLTATGRRVYKEALKTVSYVTTELLAGTRLKKAERITGLLKEIMGG